MSKTILIIEDNPKHSRLFEDILSDEGYEVETAIDGDEVKQKMDKSESSGKPLDLLLLDIAVPVFEAIKFITDYKEKYRILVVSAYADQGDVKQILDEKWRIKKPFDVDVLIERVKERLDSPLSEAKNG